MRTLRHIALMKKKPPAEKKIHQGDLTAQKGVVYDFDEITGSVSVREGATFTADALTTVGGYVSVREGATFTADALTTVGGDVYMEKGATKAPSPKKKNAGSEIALKICRDALVASLALDGLSLEDGILSRVISKRGGVSRVQIVGKSKIIYVVSRDGHNAHGDTLAQARADLLMKMGNRDTTEFKSWTLETKVSLEKMIVAYRTITGACSLGTSHFLAGKNYKGNLSVAFVIKETKGKYGHETFASFFTK